MRWLRAVVVWVAIIAAETVHGVLRGAFLAPAIGELPARQAGVAIGSLIVLVVAWLFARWLGLRATRSLLAAGLAWVVLTVAFEVVLGRSLGLSWDRLLSDYDPARGGYMAAGLLVMLLAPLAAARLRGIR